MFLFLEQLEMMESFGEEKHGVCEATLQEDFSLTAASKTDYKETQSKRRSNKRGKDE